MFPIKIKAYEKKNYGRLAGIVYDGRQISRRLCMLEDIVPYLSCFNLGELVSGNVKDKQNHKGSEVFEHVNVYSRPEAARFLTHIDQNHRQHKRIGCSYPE
jgi:hypothetical protein